MMTMKKLTRELNATKRLDAIRKDNAVRRVKLDMAPDMKKLMQELKETNLVKVTGSYADGSFTGMSDIDFYVIPNHPDTKFGERNILKIIAILDKYGIKTRSSETGYIYTHKTPGNGYLPVQLEFSDLYKPRKKRLPEVEIFGVKFKTY